MIHSIFISEPRMHRFLKHLLPLLILAIYCQSAAWASPANEELKNQSTAQIEARLAEIDTELAQLPQFTPRSGAGNIGWISTPARDPSHSEWVEVELPTNSLIDQIILVPILWNDADTGPQADGLPAEFEVIAGNEGDTEGTVLARFSPEDQFLPRVAPMIIRFPSMQASWVKVRATQLSACARNGKYVFSLAEVMVFDGAQNVAQQQPVRTSSVVARGLIPSIYKDSLTDGFTPFLMNTPGVQSNPFLARFPEDVPFSFIIDLGASYPIDAIRFHSVDVGEHFPNIYQLNYGIPQHLLIEGAEQADFSDAQQLLEYQPKSIYDAGPIIARNVPQSICRYIRLTVPLPYKELEVSASKRCVVGMAELEVISQGKNVAQGKTIRFPPAPQRMFMSHQQSITDGHNHFGTILPVKEWMEQLTRRHDLERERPLIAAELNQRYERQQVNLHRMIWVAALLTVCIVGSILIGRVLRQRAVLELRERITADLHDELSANLHGIGLLSDMAKDKITEQNTLNDILDRIRQLTERSGHAARHCGNLLEAQNLCDDLLEEMRRTSARLLADTNHEIHIKGEDAIARLSPHQRIGLFLFYKECLTNTIRHSNATQITTRLEADGKGLQMIISDQGQGTTEIPPSLQRRAKLLRATLQVEVPPAGGTQITLRLRSPIWPLTLRRHLKQRTQ
jgi:signal transduction histidine kinase